MRFGISTSTYEGWQGQVYRRKYAPTALTRECLGEFCQYLYKGQPLFRTVGMDSSFYRPSTTKQLLRYLKQIPEDFEMCSKVWEEITIPVYASTPAMVPMPANRTRDSSIPRPLSTSC